jgi:hypothetical protein
MAEMSKSRKELERKLLDIKNQNGLKGVYFEPPENLKIFYPCIVYNLREVRDSYADNVRYIERDVYSITLIELDADSPVYHYMLNSIPNIRMNSSYTSDGLYHKSFSVEVVRKI